MRYKIQVSDEFHLSRLDLFLKSQAGEDLSRTVVQRWIEEGWVTNETKNDLSTKNGSKVLLGEEYSIDIKERPPSRLEPISMDIPILWEEDEFLIIHKKPGISCHQGPGDETPSLVNGLMFQFQNLSQTGGVHRPGIVHRLDKPTEGVLVVAKTDRAHVALSRLFQERKIEKEYLAWTLQSPPDAQGSIRLPIGRHPVERIKMAVREDGRPSVTHYETQEIVHTATGRKYSMVKLNLETGRTHQIRVHLQKLGCPVVGDSLYSRSAKEYDSFGLLLLSRRLAFDHPFVPGKRIDVTIDLPERFKMFSKKCRVY